MRCGSSSFKGVGLAQHDVWSEPLDKLDANIESRFLSFDSRFNEMSVLLHDLRGDLADRLQRLSEQLQSLDYRGANGASPSRRSAAPPSFESALRSDCTARSFNGSGRTLRIKSPTLAPEETGETAAPSESMPLLATEETEKTKTIRRSPFYSEVLSDVYAQDEELNEFRQKVKFARATVRAGGGGEAHGVRLVTNFLEDPNSSCAALVYNKAMFLLTMFGIVVGLLPSADMRIPDPAGTVLDIAIDSILLTEIVVRFLFYPSWYAFFTKYINILDTVSAAPLICQLILARSDEGVFSRDFLVVTLPLSRLVRLMRRFPDMQILVSAFKETLEALPVLIYTMAVLGCFFASVIFLAEPRDNMASMSHAAWLVLSTMTTVGYGDLVPVTQVGHAATSALMIVSPLYMAMPFGIIGSSFTVIWESRKEILLLQAARERLLKWGFGAFQLPDLFSMFDSDESRMLDQQEFGILMKEMEIGFKHYEVNELFKIIDKNGSGTIDEREFVRTLYPVEFGSMYVSSRKGGGRGSCDSFGETSHSKSFGDSFGERSRGIAPL